MSEKPKVIDTTQVENILNGVKNRYPIATPNQVQSIIDDVFGTDFTPPREGVFERLYSQLRNLMPNANLLDNWWLRYPINQRSITTISVPASRTYTIDRWFAYNLVMTVDDSGTTITRTDPNTTSWIQQKFENTDYRGKLMTMSAIIDDKLYAFTGVMPTIMPDSIDTDIIDGIHLRMTTWDVANMHAVVVFLHDDKPHKITAIKLELGDYQTLAHQDSDGNWIINDPQPNYQQELEKCQRYQIVFGIGDPLGFFRRDTAAMIFYIPMAIKMHGTPNLTGHNRIRLVFGPYNGTFSVQEYTIESTPTITVNHAGMIRIISYNTSDAIPLGAMGYFDTFSQPANLIFDANI